MKTYKRIEKLNEAVVIAREYLNKRVVVADIGTDHGYLAEALSQSENVEKVIASDISEKSLSKLEKLIMQRNLNKIETYVGDGLVPIKKADIAVIAGIGGWEIIKILETQNISEDGKKKCNCFVLQPAQNVIDVRNYLFDKKIKVIKDYVIYDADRFYHILIIDLSKKQRNKRNIFNIWLGRDNDINDEDFVLFLKDTKEYFKFLNGISKARAKKDRVLYQKYKLNRLIDKLLKV